MPRRNRIHRHPLRWQLIALRRAQGWTQEALAEQSGVHKTCIADYEGGHNLPTLETLERLASALHVPICTLLGTPH
jgi:transcriptional regulator with XRE-family HTH domain